MSKLNLLRTLVLPVAGVMIFSTTVPAAPEAFEVGPEQKNQLPRGKEADGIIGDFILRNNKVEAVISGNLPLRRANMGTFWGEDGVTPGCLYDLTLRGEHNDQITIFAPAEQRGPVSYVRVVKDGKDGEATVETVQTAANNRGLYKRHEYRLRDDWQGLQIVTTLRNESSEPKQIAVADRWTNFLRTGNANEITWADAVDPGDKAGYAFGVTPEGDAIDSGKPLELKPNQTVTLARFVAVGRSPAEAAGLVAALRGTTGTLAGRIQDRNGEPIASAELTVRATAAPTKMASPMATT